MARFIPSPSGGGLPPGSQDHFAPRIIVGNVLAGDPAIANPAPFQYIGDPGDGSGIVAALAAASSGYDIRLRPGTYTLPVGTVLTVPANVSVSGEPGGPFGLNGVSIVASAGDASNPQDVFVLNVGSSLHDMMINVPAGAQGGAAGTAIVKLATAGCYVRNVTINMLYGSATAQRNTDIAFGTGSAAATSAGTIIKDCQVLMPAVESTVFAYTGILFGAFGTDSTTANGFGPTVRDCLFTGGQIGVALLSLSGGLITGCTHSGVICSQFGSRPFLAVLQVSALSTVRGPNFTNCTAQIAATGDAVGADAFAITIENDATVGNPSIEDWIISGCRVEFDSAIVHTQLHAYRAIVGNNGTGIVQKGVIADSISVNSMVGVKLDTGTVDQTDGVAGSINDIVVSAVQNIGLRATSNNPIGFDLEIDNVPTNKKINRISIIGCNASGLTSGTAVVINSSGIVDTIVVGNDIKPNGGTALLNNGTGTQYGQNIDS